MVFGSLDVVDGDVVDDGELDRKSSRHLFPWRCRLIPSISRDASNFGGKSEANSVKQRQRYIGTIWIVRGGTIGIAFCV